MGKDEEENPVTSRTSSMNENLIGFNFMKQKRKNRYRLAIWKQERNLFVVLSVA